jgi:hypothetical protein
LTNHIYSVNNINDKKETFHSEGADTFIKKYKPKLFNYCKLLKPTLDIETKYTGNATIYDLHGYAAKLAKTPFQY